ncbi:carboxylesterase from carbohydrate esterase [Epithele typhae]|uniref:carboxylesterase from carbohydrate esterase n=1 Tax=Epithele typhae TaxID=378194 RepID=UPI002007DD84|nr:carboxylesterase from carbohydrate esterase [Epithele typhae]KAH9941610.1 carboxylesterase from carbohydrate esterase [Epithele typhae]
MQSPIAFPALALFGLLTAPLAARSASVPSPLSLKSDISVLFNNDLDPGTVSGRPSVLLLSSPHTHGSASSACAVLGETLLPDNTTFIKDNLVPLLRFQEFERNFPSSQKFWIASKGPVCQTVDAKGDVSSSVVCLGSLPVLCTQSATLGAAAKPATSFTVQSKNLTITGFRDQASFRFFGIPYADPPERFTYSTPFTGNTTLNAQSFGPACVQTGETGTSENCLFLNIFTPFIPSPGSRTPLKAVMFWIHGGAFTNGMGSDPTFDGAALTSRGDVVLVTINYRLSTLGFLALDDGVTNGNFGLADQVMALDWVREHIAAFGGDPNRITIFGQSAGAGSVRALTASPQAIGKFAAAVPMSNLAGINFAATYSFYFTIPDNVAKVTAPLLESVGCDLEEAEILPCLRAVDAQTLVNVPTASKFLVVDGKFLVTPELVLNGTGPVARVHTMMGFMRDDGDPFISFPAFHVLIHRQQTTTNLTQALIDVQLPTNVTNNPLFPEPKGANATINTFNVTSNVNTDVEFRCLDQSTAFSAINHDLFESVWFYEFNRSYQIPGFNPNAPTCTPPATAARPHGDPELEYFKCHSGELFYVFGSLPADTPFRDEKDLPFMQRMVDIWASFARTFDPNPSTAFLEARGFTGTVAQLAAEPAWEPATRANLAGRPMRELQFESVMLPFGQQEQCAFLGFPLDFFG